MTKVYEVKSLEEAQSLAVKDFELPLTELDFEILKENKGFLGLGSKLEVKVSVIAEGIEKGREYLKTLLENCDFDNFIERKIRENHVEYNIDAKDYNGLLIGKNSRNLMALQTLVNVVVNRYYDEDERKTVLVDVGGYRKKRERHLEYMAVDWAKQVSRTKKQVKLTDLNAYERKIIHDRLNDWKGITTYSEGEGTSRVLIIAPGTKKLD